MNNARVDSPETIIVDFSHRRLRQFNPFKPNEFFHPYYLEERILHFRGVYISVFFICLT